MNLVHEIMEQLSGDALGELSSALGTDSETGQRATGAAVPALLSVLAGTASKDDGARKLTDMLGGIDTDSLGNVADMLGGDAASLLGKGSNMLDSLLGDGMISNVANVLSRITGINAEMIRKLLSYLAPIVLGKVAHVWKSQGGTTQALNSLFAQQRENIAGALPAGLSFGDIAGLADARKAASAAGRKARAQTAGAGPSAGWMFALALVLLGGILVWRIWSRPGAEPVAMEEPAEVDEIFVMKPVIPESTAMPQLQNIREEVSSYFTSLNTTLADIHDAASAQSAMPALKVLNTKLGSLKETLSKLPKTSIAALQPLLEDQAQIAMDRSKAATSIAGVSTEFKKLIQEIMSKITKWVSDQDQ